MAQAQQGGEQNQENQQADPLPVHRIDHHVPHGMQPTPNVLPANNAAYALYHPLNQTFALFEKVLSHYDVHTSLNLVAPNLGFLEREIQFYYDLEGLGQVVYGADEDGLAVDVCINGVEHNSTNRDISLWKGAGNQFRLNWRSAIQGNLIFSEHRSIQVWVRVNSAHRIVFFIETLA